MRSVVTRSDSNLKLTRSVDIFLSHFFCFFILFSWASTCWCFFRTSIFDAKHSSFAVTKKKTLYFSSSTFFLPRSIAVVAVCAVQRCKFWCEWKTQKKNFWKKLSPRIKQFPAQWSRERETSQSQQGRLSSNLVVWRVFFRAFNIFYFISRVSKVDTTHQRVVGGEESENDEVDFVLSFAVDIRLSPSTVQLTKPPVHHYGELFKSICNTKCRVSCVCKEWCPFPALISQLDNAILI